MLIQSDKIYCSYYNNIVDSCFPTKNKECGSRAIAVPALETKGS